MAPKVEYVVKVRTGRSIKEVGRSPEFKPMMDLAERYLIAGEFVQIRPEVVSEPVEFQG